MDTCNKANKELTAENVSLKSEIEELKAVNASLNSELTRIQNSELRIQNVKPNSKKELNPFISNAYNSGGSKRPTKLRQTRKTHR